MVTRSGQVRIEFTSTGGGTIIGIGQVRRVNGDQAMEMQMITAGGGAFTTHWASMLALCANAGGAWPPKAGTGTPLTDGFGSPTIATAISGARATGFLAPPLQQGRPEGAD